MPKRKIKQLKEPRGTKRSRARDAAWDKPWVQIRTDIRPHGKTRLLYHHTTTASAGKLVKEGFKTRKGTDTKQSYFNRARGLLRDITCVSLSQLTSPFTHSDFG